MSYDAKTLAQTRVCSTIPLSLDQLQTLDLSFHLAVASWKPEYTVDGVTISFEAARE